MATRLLASQWTADHYTPCEKSWSQESWKNMLSAFLPSSWQELHGFPSRCCRHGFPSRCWSPHFYPWVLVGNLKKVGWPLLPQLAQEMSASALFFVLLYQDWTPQPIPTSLSLWSCHIFSERWTGFHLWRHPLTSLCPKLTKKNLFCYFQRQFYHFL